MEPREGCPGPTCATSTGGPRLGCSTRSGGAARREADRPRLGRPRHSEAEGDPRRARATPFAGGGQRRVVVVAAPPARSSVASTAATSRRRTTSSRCGRRSPRLWIPAPGSATAYPFARRAGASAQDLGSPQNRKMREALAGVFEKNPPLAYASGHEHNLQVLKAPNPKVLLISGAGAYGHVTQTSATASTLFARAASGYMRLDVEKSGRVRLAVVTVAADGKATESLALDLTSEAKPTATGGEPGPAAAGLGSGPRSVSVARSQAAAPRGGPRTSGLRRPGPRPRPRSRRRRGPRVRRPAAAAPSRAARRSAVSRLSIA